MEEKTKGMLNAQFLSTISHELRTPLNSVIQGIDLLLSRDLGKINREQEKFLRIIDQDLNRLTKFINDLLDISKIDVAGMKLNMACLDINSLIEDTLVSFNEETRAKHIKVEDLSSKETLQIWGDYKRVEQILHGLVHNAIKFNKPKGKVIINTAVETGEDNKEYVKLIISDTGCGIAKDSLDKLFDISHQVDKTKGAGPRGTGLSIIIIKELIQLHGGCIAVESEPDQGTKVIFTLQKFNPDLHKEAEG